MLCGGCHLDARFCLEGICLGLHLVRPSRGRDQRYPLRGDARVIEEQLSVSSSVEQVLFGGSLRVANFGEEL